MTLFNNMEDNKAKGMQGFMIFYAILSELTLIAQFVLLFFSSQLSFPLIILRYFSYFTILTNLLASFYFTTRSFAPKSKLGIFFSQNTVSTAICGYMLFVGLSYSILLRHLWKPEGMQLIVDELLHSVLPLLFLSFWFVYGSRNKISWISFVSWLIYPLVYFIYALVISPVIGLYPYAFIDAKVLGYPVAIKNGLELLVFFAFISLVLIAINRVISRPSKGN